MDLASEQEEVVGDNSNLKLSKDMCSLSKEDLFQKIRQLETQVIQLKNIIAKGSGLYTKESKLRSGERPFDWTKQNKRHVALKILYLGWDFHGFVVQDNTNKTIENVLFEALIKTKLIECRETSNYHRCGRTDKGVSAFCQVISIDLRSTHTNGKGFIPYPDAKSMDICPEEIDYVGILNRILPKEIRVLAWAPVDEEFSARFDCTSRTYKYFFPKGDLDISLMNQAAQKLIGVHDFRNLCKMDVGNGVTEFMRDIQSVEVVSDSHDTSGYSMCIFTVKSKAFLWHQIRCIMAVLYLVGKGLEKPDLIDQMLDVKLQPCKPQYSLASELPLNLFECSFDGVEWIYHKESVGKVMSHLQSLWAEESIKAKMLQSMIESLQDKTGLSLEHQSDSIIPDYRRFTKYRPLSSRQTCSSLEERKEYYAKRRKIDRILCDEPHDGNLE